MGDMGEPDNQECRDILTGVTDIAGEVVTRGPGRGEAGVWGDLVTCSGDLEKPGELGWSLSSLNCSMFREMGDIEWRGDNIVQIEDRLEVRRIANMAISTR